MGIGGHILGPKKLRELNRWAPVNFRRAYNRNGFGQGCVPISEHACYHLAINFNQKTVGRTAIFDDKWTSCPKAVPPSQED